MKSNKSGSGTFYTRGLFLRLALLPALLLALLMVSSCNETTKDQGLSNLLSPTGVSSSGTSGGSTIITSGSGALTSSAKNVMTVTVNGSLCGDSRYQYANEPCVSVTLCQPGTSNCQ